MAASGNAARTNRPANDAVAAAVQTQLSLVSSFERWLASRAGAGALSDVIVRAQRQLDNYKRWLAAACQSPSELPGAMEAWDMDARVQVGGGLVILVTGPGSGEPVKVAAKDEKELESLMSDKCLRYMVKICSAFAKAQTTLQSLVQTTNEIEEETACLSQAPEATVKTYIRGLQEYNDIKDIGQQLIGLVAENRGVPVRTLYENGEFGVGFPC